MPEVDTRQAALALVALARHHEPLRMALEVAVKRLCLLVGVFQELMRVRRRLRGKSKMRQRRWLRQYYAGKRR